MLILVVEFMSVAPTSKTKNTVGRMGDQCIDGFSLVSYHSMAIHSRLGTQLPGKDPVKSVKIERVPSWLKIFPPRVAPSYSFAMYDIDKYDLSRCLGSNFAEHVPALHT